MEKNEKMWQHVDRAFEHAHNAFAEAKEAFKHADWDKAEILRESGTHGVRFTAKSWSDRWRMARHFLSVATAIAFRGKATLHFKTTKESR